MKQVMVSTCQDGCTQIFQYASVTLQLASHLHNVAGGVHQLRPSSWYGYRVPPFRKSGVSLNSCARFSGGSAAFCWAAVGLPPRLRRFSVC
jgi:hypothetical protein